MTTVAQMIEWLQTLPQDAIVECYKEETCGYNVYTTFDVVDIQCCDILDYTGDDCKHYNSYGKVFVQIRSD